ncbi:Phage integrase, N-terminal SAM-like domain [Saccharopolyspora kobensis]|uniref:Phage integrase, N-terminal SAM-like domain n=1 Tax=Saccharopolyspora kobensis TaxID=146035 RepID=A0A1H5VRV0_9PSEU|nr:phage integrase N-terminal SAM-like domain-containing protein [Saccharopolyspora kobensis]SEF90029.1 Phage integrase, N-terminal SAM-like domain [Saccharopolyspora kobensis]SFC57677.1 Phage integrase, N-terminal SAM-like domain [Saccharopolyspora kobensis]
MPLMDLERLTDGLSVTWAGYLRDWDRSLRSANRPETTRYNYLLAAAQLARYLAEHSPDPDAAEASEDPAEVTKAHVEAFQAWMIETRSAATAVNKHKALQQFFKWLMFDEEEIDRSPMEHVRLPKAPTKLVPVIESEATTRLLEACKGKDFLRLQLARKTDAGGVVLDVADADPLVPRSAAWSPASQIRPESRCTGFWCSGGQGRWGGAGRLSAHTGRRPGRGALHWRGAGGAVRGRYRPTSTAWGLP